jgi:uncharacterized protein YbbC (DUF1343 family)
MRKVYLLFALLVLTPKVIVFGQNLKLGADRLDVLLPEIQGKNIALVVNHTSLQSDGTHLIDALLQKEVRIKTIFAPEHGLRGTASAGETIKDGKDTKTGIPVTSLYGKNYKPTADQLKGIDVVIFDIQDVGARFYTYISTMHYVMEACAENNKLCVILDRPNPHDYIDGPILNLKYRSFVGMHQIPVLHGLTIGELAQMVNDEGWLKDAVQCHLKVVTMQGWEHGDAYALPERPSPNLSNMQAIGLYPSLCFFEATNVSVGRGTDFPFQVIGAPDSKYGSFAFTPASNEGAKSPLNMNQKCYGEDLRNMRPSLNIDLDFLIRFYKKSGQGEAFFTNARFMDLLSGTDQLRLQIIKGATKEEIYKSWQTGLTTYKELRKKYLLYSDDRNL